MRVLAVSALACAVLIGAPETAEACGAGGEAEFVPRDSTALLLARADDLDEQAEAQNDEAAAADRRAKKLIQRARLLQQRAVQREGVELAELLEDARSLALQAQEAKAHAKRARQRAQNFRAQARTMRARAVQVSDFEPAPRRRSTRTSFAL